MRRRRKKTSKPSSYLWLAALLVGGYLLVRHTPLTDMFTTHANEHKASETMPEIPSLASRPLTSEPSKQKTKSGSLQLRLELPVSTHTREEIIVRHTGFTLSYNPEMLTPNWVAWELNRSETEGEEGRENKFSPDPDLPEPRVTHRDYSNSGYDRGHMAPAADMKWSEQSMKESFYTSNICPQNRKLNRDDWKDLENACRDWAQTYGTIYIACGPIYDSATPQRIGEHGVAVPDRFYKVVLVYNRKKPFTLAFLFKNEAHHQALSKYQTTVDQVEEITGYDFFAKLPDGIEKQIESVVTPLPTVH